jgi:hypothetical protein
MELHIRDSDLLVHVGVKIGSSHRRKVQVADIGKCELRKILGLKRDEFTEK